MSKFIITYSDEEIKEAETPEDALKLVTEETIEIREEYPNGHAFLRRNDLEDAINQKKAAEEYEAEQLKLKQTEEK